MIRHVGILCLFLLVTWPASGSAQTGSVTGSVVDQTGLVLSGTTVTLRGDGVPRTVYSDERGDFELSGGIAPGTYTLTVSLTGFSDATVNDVVVSDGVVVLPEVVLQLASFGDTVVVTASRNEVRLIDAPVSMSVISTATLETTPAQNYGDLLRATPGVNVIQLSARDVQVTSRSPGNTLTNSQLVLVDGRSVYLDFFGLVMWDLLPTNFDDVEQIEVVRGPASAVWGANAMTGAVNIITKPPRESVGTTVTLSGGYVDRNDGSGVGLGEGSMFGANATVTRAPSDRLSYRVSGGYFRSDAFARPTGRIPVIDDPRQPGQTVGGAFYPLDSGTAAFGTGFANRGTSQPKFEVRVDQELSDATITYSGGVAGTEGIVHSGIGPFDMQSGTYMGYGKLNYTRGDLQIQFFANFLDGKAPNLLLPDIATGMPLQLDFKSQTFDGEIGHSVFLGSRQRAAEQLRHHPRTAWREPPRGGRVPAGRDLLGTVPPRSGRARGQIRQPLRPKVLAADRVHRQAGRGSLRHAVVQPSLPCAVGHQQRPADEHRQPGGPERPRAASAAGAAASGRPAVSARGRRVRQRHPDRRDAPGRVDGGIVDGVRSELHWRAPARDDARRLVLRQPAG